MTNQQRAAGFRNNAEGSLADMRRALEAGHWNLALRRAQEVVELTLKGLIVLMGGDYPKVHDAAVGFASLIRQRGVAVPEEDLSLIIALSNELAIKRAPAFYGEIEVAESEALRATRGAEMVFDLGKRLWSEVGPEERRSG